MAVAIPRAARVLATRLLSLLAVLDVKGVNGLAFSSQAGTEVPAAPHSKAPPVPLRFLRKRRQPLQEHEGECSLAFVAHSGFANQLFGLLNAALVAKEAGCGLLLPPILHHHDLAYEWPDDVGGRGAERCLEGTDYEWQVIRNASKAYMARTLQYDQVFDLAKTPLIHGTFASLNRPLDSLRQLPLNCSVWDMVGHNSTAYSEHLRGVVSTGDPEETWVFGSGFRVFHRANGRGIRELGLQGLFTGFAAPVRLATSQLVFELMRGSFSNIFGCIHLRRLETEDPNGTAGAQREALRRWIERQTGGNGSLTQDWLQNIGLRRAVAAGPAGLEGQDAAASRAGDGPRQGRAAGSSLIRRLCDTAECIQPSGAPVPLLDAAPDGSLMREEALAGGSYGELPLYVMSSLPGEELDALLGPACGIRGGGWSGGRRRCFAFEDLEAAAAPLTEVGFPEEDWETRRLVLELATCSRANVIYLPNYAGSAPAVMLNGKLQSLSRTPELFQSTLSVLVGTMQPWAHEQLP